MGPIGSKVIEVKGQIYVCFFYVGHVFFCLFPYFSQVLGPIFTKLPDSSRGSFFKGQGHRGQRSNFCISAVLGPICMKLGECIQVDP